MLKRALREEAEKNEELRRALSGAMTELEVSHQQNDDLHNQLERHQGELAAVLQGLGSQGQGLGGVGGGGGKSSESKGEVEEEVDEEQEQEPLVQALATTVFDDEDSVEEAEKQRAEREAAVAEAVAAERERMWELSERATQHQLEGLQMQMARQVEELDAFRERLAMAQLQVTMTMTTLPSLLLIMSCHC